MLSTGGPPRVAASPASTPVYAATDPRTLEGNLRTNGDEVVGPRHRQRPQQKCIGPAERRGVGADPDGQRREGDEREHRAAPERADRVSEVGGQVVDPTRLQRVAAPILHVRDCAKLLPGTLLGRGRRHAGALIHRGLHREMKRDLVVEVALDAAAAEERSQPQGDDVDPLTPSHRDPQTSFKRTTRVIAEESRSQLAASSSR
jgi:hypothetical protein